MHEALYRTLLPGKSLPFNFVSESMESRCSTAMEAQVIGMDHLQQQKESKSKYRKASESNEL